MFGNSWLNSLTNTTIHYRFPDSNDLIYAPGGETATFSPLSNDQERAARLAFATWDDLISQKIIETKDLPDIDLGNSTTNTDYAHAYYPTRSSIWFNNTSDDLQHPKVGSYGFETFTHEIGHSLGLQHMGDYNGEGTWTPSCYQDSSVYSVMSYFGPEHHSGEGKVAWANWSADGISYSPQTPMLNDVMAIQHIYGADSKTRLGNTIYGFNTNIEGALSSIYDFKQNLHPILTFYDAGGVDTLDLSGWKSSNHINLEPGAFSDCNEMTSNLCIAYDTIIENLITGGGDDLLHGNDASNYLIGGAGNDSLIGGSGNDVLDGGVGIDTAQYQHGIKSYKIGFDGKYICLNSTHADSPDVDHLINIENIEFFDRVESIHLLPKATHLSGRLSDFFVFGQGDNLTVIDNKHIGQGINVYQDSTRIFFDDLAVATDLDRNEAAGSVYRLYLSLLGRNPQADTVGTGFWIDKLDRGLTTVEGLVDPFLKSAEFIKRYGDTTSTNESFVNLLYLNLLGRDGHPDSGFNFWKSLLDSNTATRAQVVVGFMESDENIANSATIIGDHAIYKPWIE